MTKVPSYENRWEAVVEHNKTMTLRASFPCRVSFTEEEMDNDSFQYLSYQRRCQALLALEEHIHQVRRELLDVLLRTPSPHHKKLLQEIATAGRAGDQKKVARLRDEYLQGPDGSQKGVLVAKKKGKKSCKGKK